MSNQPGDQGQAAKAAADQLKEKAQQVGQNLRDIGQSARSAATEQVGRIKDQANDYYEQGLHRVQDAEQNIEQYVHEKPLQALLVAAGVGLLLGMLWRRS